MDPGVRWDQQRVFKEIEAENIWMSALSQILKNKIVAIIRGADPADILNIAYALQQYLVNLNPGSID